MIDARFGRSLAGAMFTNTLGIAYETRKITLAQGIQFNNTDFDRWPFLRMPYGLDAPASDRTKKWPRSMRRRPPLPLDVSGSTFSDTSVAQGVKFEVTIVNTKPAFRAALLTPEMHVIYAGHARFGRGPCFGVLPVPDEIAPGEDWENGTSPDTGLFRMGFPFIGVPASEVIEHGYTADLADSTTTITASQSEMHLRPFISSLKAKTAADIHPDLPSFIKDKDPTKTFWTYRSYHGGKLQRFVILNAGWTGTVSAPNDLGATTPTCRAFCHFGCDTFKHNHEILRSASYKGWKKGGGEKYAYFTTAISTNLSVGYWLYHLFTYKKPNAFQDWEPSLDYAVRKVNNDLDDDGYSYHII